ncbi:hypothetical protein F5X98DRAFT_158178 [Xylaria grammica]|nr:hypothetical protein F5X98DRAFT_158178 [Xylaria grammica]
MDRRNFYPHAVFGRRKMRDEGKLRAHSSSQPQHRSRGSCIMVDMTLGRWKLRAVPLPHCINTLVLHINILLLPTFLLPSFCIGYGLFATEIPNDIIFILF